LITVGGDRSETAAMQRAIAAHERLSAGDAFVSVAAEFSEDTTAAENNHRYDDANLAEVVPALANAMREVGEGNFSVPVRSQFGWHIGSIVATHPPEVLPWADVQARAEERARRDHLTAVWERQLRQAQAQPAVFPPGAIRRLLSHYGIESLSMISEADLVEEMEP
jgi:parvulin-like peptidyl-prolyl isomerase